MYLKVLFRLRKIQANVTSEVHVSASEKSIKGGWGREWYSTFII